MPLASCPDCNREVSTRARQCVHCGRPWPGRTCGLACGIAMAAVVALCVLAAAAVCRFRPCEKIMGKRCVPAQVESAPAAAPEAPDAEPAPAPPKKEE